MHYTLFFAYSDTSSKLPKELGVDPERGVQCEFQPGPRAGQGYEDYRITGLRDRVTGPGPGLRGPGPGLMMASVNVLQK